MKNIKLSKSQLTSPCDPRNFDGQGCPNRSVTCKMPSSDDYCKAWDRYEEDKAREREEMRKKARLTSGERALSDMFFDNSEKIRRRTWK